jgi:chemotaxis protein histidine kinase CheA
MYCDPSLLELFHAEAEAHMSVLTAGLLALERDPNQVGRFEALMRAAHSIKGAARIVGLDQAVALAHVIEDCFVAARQGQVMMGSETVDVLLPAVDMLQQVTQSGGSASGPTDGEVHAVVERVRATMSGKGSGADRLATERPRSSAAPSVAEAADSLPRFQPTGSLNASWVVAQRGSLLACLQSNVAEIQWDFSATSAIDPAGAALLVVLAREAARRQPPLVLRVIASRPEIDRWLTVTALDSTYRLPSAEG